MKVVMTIVGLGYDLVQSFRFGVNSSSCLSFRYGAGGQHLRPTSRTSHRSNRARRKGTHLSLHCIIHKSYVWTPVRSLLWAGNYSRLE
ncbi:hypothetical protein Hdeb2414_s0002g00067811 [Helianthus debilis subsp. tardiflorus]